MEAQPPVIQTTYDWTEQKAVLTTGDGHKLEPVQTGSLRGTQSFVGSQLVIDDFQQD
jgi:hypothetical protein